MKNFPLLANLTFCMGDREPEDLLTYGHMNDVVARAVFFGGVLAAEEGRLLAPLPERHFEVESRNAVNVNARKIVPLFVGE